MTQDIDQIMKQAQAAFVSFRSLSGKSKKELLYTIAEEIEALGDHLLQTASQESNLPVARFVGERMRTCNQLRSFGDLVAEGSWVEAVIDTANPENKPAPKPDMRKMLIALGPIVVFGASNFPLAYSTAGGDTASALAAGCPVIVKAHPSHPQTSSLVAGAIHAALKRLGLDPHIFQHVEGTSFEIGKMLTQHPYTAGVGFTGSLSGGRAIFDYAQQRAIPIPVFSEMGSTNPVILLDGALENHAAEHAKAFAGSITIGVGQFCTNPGIMLGTKGKALENFIELLASELSQIPNYKMLSESIHQNYSSKLEKIISDKDVKTVYQANTTGSLVANSALVTVVAEEFAKNPNLHHEVFGPFSMIVICEDKHQLVEVWKILSGQLTTTILGTDEDLSQHADLLDIATKIAGRVIFNQIPTGVDVGNATVHGGPYPATTDSRFTSVGMDAIKRWVRPLCYQNCPDYLLPDALKNGNPLGIMRKVNGDYNRN